MRAARLRRLIGWYRSRHIHERRRSEAGDTLVEILVAVAIMGLSATAILGGLASALGSSGTHRSLTNLDAILRSYAETARYNIQLRPASQGGPLFRPCVNFSYYSVVSAPYPSGGSPGTAVTVFGSGFTAPTGTQSVKVTDSGGTTDTVGATIQIDAFGNFTSTFVLPAGLNSGPAMVTITDGSNSASAASTFDVDPSAPVVYPSPLAEYQVGFTGIDYWNGTGFQATCDTSSPDDQLQELTVSGKAPGASDQLNIIVADTNYVFPPPQVASTFIGQNSAPGPGFGYLANHASYTVYANVIEPDGLPGISSVTADVSGISSGETAVPLSPVPGGGSLTALNGQVYNYSSSPLTAGSQGDGTTVAYSVNAMDTEGLPSEYSNNGTVTFDNAAPTSGSVSIDNAVNPNGYITTTPLQVSFSAADSESGVDANSGYLTELSTPMAPDGSCQGPLGNPTVVETGGTSPQSDPTTASGNCYQYEYTVPDNVGNQATFTMASPVKVDTVAPTLNLSFTNKTNVKVSGSTGGFTVGFGALAPGGAGFTVTANATDPVFTNLSYSFSNPPKGWSVTGGGDSRSYSWTGSKAKSGTITVTVTNGAGLQTSTTITLIPDNGSPTVSVMVVGAGGYITSAPVVTFSATPNGHGVNTAAGQLLQLSAPLLGGTCGTFGNSVQVGSTGVTSPYSDNSVISGNCYEYEYVVPDDLGNQGTATSGPVMFDTTAPSVSIQYPVGGSTYTTTPGQSNTWTGTVTGTAGDTASTLTTVEVAVEDTTTQMWWDGTAFDLAAQPPGATASGTTLWTYPLPRSALVEGEQYQVEARATDAAGLTSDPTIASFTG